VDNQGTVWATAGADGVSRLDGTGWTHYCLDAGTIAVGARGDVWFGGRGALYRYNGSEWWRYDSSDGVDHPGGTSVLGWVAVDRDGVVWASKMAQGVAPSGQRQELVSFDGQRWTAYDLPKVDVQDYVCGLVVDGENRVWVSTPTSLFARDRGIWSRYAGREFSWVSGLTIDGQGRCWFGAVHESTVYIGFLRAGRWTGVAGTLDQFRPHVLAYGGSGLWFTSPLAPGLIRWPWEDLPTAVGAEPGPALPQSFGLLQNRPNPFNQQTQISFALPVTQQASLEVRNATGQRVTTLAAGQFTAGAHVVNWDGRDARGMAVGSGVYLCRLAAASGTDVRKLTLLR